MNGSQLLRELCEI